MLPQTAVNLPNFGGVKNVIDKVVVQSKKSLIELTNVNNYGQYSGLTEAYSNNKDEYPKKPLIRSLSCGTHQRTMGRRMLSACPTRVGGGESAAISANDRSQGQHFSIPIQVDLLGKQKNSFITDANNITYSWTEGTGW